MLTEFEHELFVEQNYLVTPLIPNKNLKMQIYKKNVEDQIHIYNKCKE